MRYADLFKCLHSLQRWCVRDLYESHHVIFLQRYVPISYFLLALRTPCTPNQTLPKVAYMSGCEMSCGSCVTIRLVPAGHNLPPAVWCDMFLMIIYRREANMHQLPVFTRLPHTFRKFHRPPLRRQAGIYSIFCARGHMETSVSWLYDV